MLPLETSNTKPLICVLRLVAAVKTDDNIQRRN